MNTEFENQNNKDIPDEEMARLQGDKLREVLKILIKASQFKVASGVVLATLIMSKDATEAERKMMIKALMDFNLQEQRKQVLDIERGNIECLAIAGWSLDSLKALIQEIKNESN